MPSSTLDQLRTLLRSGKEFTLDELSDELDVSRRQLRRLRKQLEEEGLEIKERRKNGCKRLYLAGEDLPSGPVELSFLETELLALSVAAEASQEVLHQTPFADSLQGAIDKIINSARADIISFEPELTPEQWHFSSGGRSDIDPDIFETAVKAVHNCETLAIDYYAASSGKRSTDRPVNPYVIARVGSTWMLAAYCHNTGRVLDFSLANISSVQQTGEYFVRPNDFDPELRYRERFGAVESNSNYVVRLRVSPEKAPHFRNKEYHPTQLPVEDLPDGGLIVSYEVAGLDEVAAFVRSWGPDVKVLAPDELIDRIQEDLDETRALYE